MKTETIHIGSRSHVDPSNIKMLVSDINYTKIHFKDGTKKLVSTTMGIIESRLPNDAFVRINRQKIINKSTVIQYFMRDSFDEILLEDASFLKVSRRRKDVTRQILIKETI
jgi:two-component system, LytTR family, response regulator